ncbi:uncharacterized protein LOC132872786 isoform X2 [Neoarius graeffei]|nr:uncharacterized protein LOC132872786 isoform X2 [Neoarius graeffei]
MIFAISEDQRREILKKTSLNGYKITSHVPGAIAKKRGVITGIPVSVSIEDIKNNLKGGEIVDAKRLTKGKEKTESLSILLHFKDEMPDKIQMGFMCYPVREYIPPPLRCFKCQRFGHVAAQCKGKLRCAKCGEGHEYGKCGENAQLKCCNCGGQHSAAYGGCERQKEAKEVQKYKVTYHVSYADALKEINKAKKDTNANRNVSPSKQVSWTPISYAHSSSSVRQNDDGTNMSQLTKWNARSLIANGQEFKRYSEHRRQWKEREAENGIVNILKEEGMQRDKMKSLFIFLNNSGGGMHQRDVICQ